MDRASAQNFGGTTMQSFPELDIPAKEVRSLLSVADRLDPSERPTMLERAGDAEGRIDIAALFRMLRCVARATGEESLALSRRPLMVGSNAFVISIAQGCHSVGEAMRQIARSYNMLHGGNYNAVEQRGYRITFVIRDERYPYTRPHDGYLHFAMECTLIWVHGLLCELAQRDLSLSLRRVDTRRPRLEGPGANALGFWGVPMTYGGKMYAIAYDASMAALPISPITGGIPLELAVENRIAALIEARHAHKREPASAGVGSAVRRVLRDGMFEQKNVARRLNVSVATLRRRLTEEGTDFRSLRADAMTAYARARLVQATHVAVIGEELGFSDARAFSRAFKKWTGCTPTDWRRSHGTAALTAPAHLQ
jgi:AraC-like DNA-binding protein